MTVYQRQKIFDFFEIAGRVASSRRDKRAFFLGAIGVRRDGAMVHAFNSANQERYHATHAERRLCRKLDSGAVVYVARIRKGDGQFGLAKPCQRCQAILKSYGVRRIYYTIANAEYGVITL